MNVVLVREPNPPPGETAVEWILVTTLPIDTPEQVRTIVEYYCVRWTHRNSVPHAEIGLSYRAAAFRARRPGVAVSGLYLIVAWRTLFVCRMGRELPGPGLRGDLRAIGMEGGVGGREANAASAQPPRLAEMVHLIASLGGYVERPKSEPGTQTLWIGLQRMYDLAWAWDTFGPGAATGKT